MFKGIRFLFIIVIILSSCGNSKQEGLTKQDAKSAEMLLAEAKNALQNNKPEEAMNIVEYIDSIHKEDIEIRRELLKLRPQIKERLIIKDIQIIDSLLVVYEINNPGVEIVYKTRVKKEKLERQLQVARNQIARMN